MAKKEAPEVIEVQRKPEKFEALLWDGSNTNAVLKFLPNSTFVPEVNYLDPAQREVHTPKHIWPDGAGVQSLQVGDYAILPEIGKAFALTPEQFAQAFEPVVK